MKKILYLVTQSELGGAQRYVLDLAKNLKDEIEVRVGFGEQGEKGKLAEKLKENNIRYYAIPHLKRSISPFNDLLALIEIIKLIKETQPNVIHLNSSKISILGSLGAFFSGVNLKVVYTVHGWVFNEPLLGFKKIFFKYAEKFTALFKDKIICINELDYNIARDILKIKEKKLTLIHHGLDLIPFLDKEEAREILSHKFNIPQEKFLIGTIGNLYKTKGFKYFIEAIKILAPQGIEFTTVIIGEGIKRKDLEHLIKKYNLENNFILAGSIDNAAEILKAFDIYVCSSVKEGFPYSILEAMAARLPIVSTRVGGIPEILTDKENGLLIDPRNPEQLAQKIKLLMENSELAETLGRNAEKNVQERFGVERMTKKTKEVYQ